MRDNANASASCQTPCSSKCSQAETSIENYTDCLSMGLSNLTGSLTIRTSQAGVLLCFAGCIPIAEILIL